MKNLIKPLYRILLLYEDAVNEKSKIKEEDYLKYLNRISIKYAALDNDVYDYIIGLYNLGLKVSHDNIKSVVFHMIGLLDGGENNGS